MERRVHFTVGEGEKGERQDVLLPSITGCSRVQAQRSIEAGSISVNGIFRKPSYRVSCGDRITGEILQPPPLSARPEAIEIPIIYEDEQLLVVNKPAGMVTHPAPGAASGTLVNALLDRIHIDAGGDALRPGIVHRLDKNTSGLLVVAKTQFAFCSLQTQIKRHQVERRYLAIVWGEPSFHTATVDAPIGRNPSHPELMAIITDPTRPRRAAVTHLTVLCSNGIFSLLEARLETGRTHQIRVHLSSFYLPVVGDPTYSAPAYERRQGVATEVMELIAGLPGQALHAFRLAFTHPETGERMYFYAEPPLAMSQLLESLDFQFSASCAENP
ncbi:MAG: RluA family pseudouridine synthase [Armatimonadetes bacterium]|nr:RluA family pseudouridine synthase [Armatimonadota bacterium]